MGPYKECSFGRLEGKTLVDIHGMKESSGEVLFKCSDGTEYRMHHKQDCCECVTVNEVIGDVSDLLNAPILVAEESGREATREEAGDHSGTWTFYHIRTVKGAVTLRWLGSSNGYYSEDVRFEQYVPKQERSV